MFPSSLSASGRPVKFSCFLPWGPGPRLPAAPAEEAPWCPCDLSASPLMMRCTGKGQKLLVPQVWGLEAQDGGVSRGQGGGSCGDRGGFCHRLPLPPSGGFWETLIYVPWLVNTSPQSLPPLSHRLLLVRESVPQSPPTPPSPHPLRAPTPCFFYKDTVRSDQGPGRTSS